MAITIFGATRRILMPDGNWLFKDSGGNGSSWCRLGGWTVMGGLSNTNGGSTTISFPYTFPEVCVGAVVCESNPSGWDGTGMTVYGASSITQSSMTVRGIFKKNGDFYGPVRAGLATGFEWIAYGY